LLLLLLLLHRMPGELHVWWESVPGA
jgi:hypothetical protein